MSDNQLLIACKNLINEDDLKINDNLKEYLLQNSIKAEFITKNERQFLKIYSLKKLTISKIVPLLHDIGFSIIEEIAFETQIGNKKIYINKFLLSIKEDIERAKENIVQILEKALKNEILDRCSLYALSLKENMDVKDIFLLKALLRYENQLILEFSFNRIVKTFLKYSHIAKSLVEFFKAKFNPKLKNRKAIVKKYCQTIEDSLKKIKNATEDKTIRILYLIIENSLRTNYFLNKETISFKIDTSALTSFLIGIQPKIEAFVHHQNFNGIHLRMSKVSRGGIRWSDRLDDFREEIKSLMSTQEAKNAIIVPAGAKGGFVIYKDKKELSYEEFKECYSLFIDALLDLIDNKKDGKIVKQKDIAAYDKEDFYFVVAADKGTASMSDTANEIATKRGYWLEDAFASGGSKGYSHKELGVTAKGAWKSVARFFIEKNIDIYKDEISVVGIGSMRGDVFGNGMLINPNIKLLCAISHNEVFVDPNPDPKTSYEERLRLFREGLSWDKYDKNKISNGGGVFKRGEPNIKLTPEIKKLLKTKKESLSGEELAKKLLTLKVDLLYNGGVGTYVKSSEEENIYLSDKQNEGVRVSANELRCFAVCEGGNLGFTQKARIEYALNGGKINLDSIDNSAGVNTSDHEVNLKIILNSLKEKNIINEEERIKTLKGLTDKVLNSVFWDNYLQSLAISLDEIRSSKHLNSFIKTVEILEKNISIFKRKDFEIPKSKDFETVLTAQKTIVRPVLGILLSYSKIFIKNILLKSSFLDSPFAKHYLYKYFPKSLGTLYDKEIQHHPLSKEIIATVISNKIINFAGCSFVADYDNLGECKFLKKIESYLIINRLINANDIRFELYRKDFKIASNKQYELLLKLENTIDFSIRWMIKKEKNINPTLILGYQQEIEEQINMEKKKVHIKKIVSNEKIDSFFSILNYLKFIAVAIDIKQETDASLQNLSNLFYWTFEKFKINSILNSIENYKPAHEYEYSIKDEQEQLIEFFVTKIITNALKFPREEKNSEKLFDTFLKNHFKEIDKILKEIDDFCSKKSPTLSEITHIVNSLVLLVI